MQCLELTHSALLDAVLVSTYTNSHTPCLLENAPPPLCKAARPIRLQGERSGAAENQLGDLLSGDGGQENAMAKVASSNYEIIQFTMT